MERVEQRLDTVPPEAPADEPKGSEPLNDGGNRSWTWRDNWPSQN
jgi:hypothetical protein